ncbi:hypothetical protein Rhe02_65930 [Rhizocola hellebori]|uniref:PASTA domain-containing protein n=1 Tax=Rhizocola hellebori TaxID=1392758 RepID=A0A8J3QFV9_9ACTN|nr:PASTA domain-containing protein [Rhizocola hellebori]GIH08526.1 hypothetical protein Rhe02_65930 [Rhizocola hellebori]
MWELFISWFSAHRFARIALAAVVLVAAAAVSFASGYDHSGSILGDGSAYLQKDHAVVRVNGDTGFADSSVDADAARKLATGTQRLEVVQVRPGLVYVVNNETGEAFKLPTDTMKPEQIDKRPESVGRLKLETGGDNSYLVDAERGSASKLDGSSGPGVEVQFPAKIDQLAVDSSGTGWAYAPETGELFELNGDRVRSRQPVAGRGERLVLTLAANQPVLYRPGNGQASIYGRDGLLRRLDLAAENAIVAAPTTEPVIVVFVPRTGELVVAGTVDGDIRRTVLQDRRGDHTRFGRPIVFSGRAYLPDYIYHHVVVIGLAKPALSAAEPVPGTTRQFEIFLRDNRVWVSDPYDKTVITFDRDGRKAEFPVDGGPPRPTATPAPTATRTAVPTQAPGAPTPPRPETMVVPNVIGQDRAQACQRLKPLRCQQVAQPDGDGRTGMVLSTNPPPGSRVSVDSRITVFYRGPAEVPADLVGMTAADACATIRRAQLNCVENVTGVAPTAPQAFVVTAQQPVPGAKVNTGSDVTITYAANVAVPSVVGAAVDQGCAQLESPTHAFRCVRRDLGSAAGTGHPPGVIIAQTPAANASAARNADVVVDFYGNANTTVPAVVGMDPGTACATLAAAFLGCAQSDYEATLQLGVVHAQSIGGGAVVPAGTGVTIVYETTGPVQLQRWKAPGARRANFIAATGSNQVPPAGWSSQPSSPIAVYLPATEGVPGIAPIYRSRCASGCGEIGGYYYSGNPAAQAGYVMEGEAFRCFDPAAAPGGTKDLHALFMDNFNTWVFAVPGTYEWDYFHANPIKFDFVICRVW